MAPMKLRERVSLLLLLLFLINRDRFEGRPLWSGSRWSLLALEILQLDRASVRRDDLFFFLPASSWQASPVPQSWHRRRLRPRTASAYPRIDMHAPAFRHGAGP
jgi:hypothetical protein